MSVYGNIVLKESKDSTNYVYITIEKDDIEVTLGFPKVEALKEDYRSTKEIELEKNGIEVKVMVRSKYGQGGRNGNPSQHDASIKILYPKKYDKAELSVPHRNDSKDILVLSGKDKILNDKEIKMVKDFIIKNSTDIRAIYYSQDDKHVENSYKHMIRSNIDIIKNVKDPNDSVIEKYFKKKKGEL